MLSITKQKLTEDEIQRMVNHAFGENCKACKITEADEGWYSAVYLISLSNGRNVLLKVAPSSSVNTMRYEKNIMYTEVEVTKLLKAQGNIPVPEVYFYDNTGKVIENEYYFRQLFNGMAYNKVKDALPKETVESIEKELGMYNKKINSVKGKSFGLFSQKDNMSEKWSDAFLSMVKGLLQDACEYDIKLPMEYEKIQDIFESQRTVLDLVKEPSLIHWDLHAGNVFIDDNNKIEGIIDFERSLWGDPLMEFYFSDFADRKYFSLGYGDSMIDTKEGKIRRKLYDLYLYLVMVIECKYRKFENEEHIKWTYNNLKTALDNFIR